MSNLGFVGLGVMGGRMVKRLLDAGHLSSLGKEQADELEKKPSHWASAFVGKKI